MTLKELLSNIEACDEALEFVGDKTFAEAWPTAWPGWKRWFACARPANHLFQPGHAVGHASANVLSPTNSSASSQASMFESSSLSVIFRFPLSYAKYSGAIPNSSHIAISAKCVSSLCLLQLGIGFSVITIHSFHRKNGLVLAMLPPFRFVV